MSFRALARLGGPSSVARDGDPSAGSGSSRAESRDERKSNREASQLRFFASLRMTALLWRALVNPKKRRRLALRLAQGKEECKVQPPPVWRTAELERRGTPGHAGGH